MMIHVDVWQKPSQYCKEISLSFLLFSCSVMSDTLWPHELQHTRLPCPSLSPRVQTNSCPLSWWCHLTISSFIIPFFSCPQPFPASGSFPMSWLCSLGGQNIGASVSASVLPMNIQDWFFFRIDLFDILAVQTTLKSVLQQHNFKASVLWCSTFCEMCSTLTSVHN